MALVHSDAADNPEDQYYMFEQEVWVMTPVLSTQDPDRFHAKFSYFLDPREDI